MSLSRVIQWFKTMTTNEYFRGVRTDCWTPVRAKLWQRGLNDHVIRSEDDLLAIREYIEFNPVRCSSAMRGGHTGPPLQIRPSNLRIREPANSATRLLLVC